MVSAAAEAQTGQLGGAADGESASKRHNGEGAARASTSVIQAGGEPVGYEHASDVPRQSGPETGEQQAATNGHGQHLQKRLHVKVRWHPGQPSSTLPLLPTNDATCTRPLAAIHA